MADEMLPTGVYEAADEAFEGWCGYPGKKAVEAGAPRDELESALVAAAPLIRAAERDRIRQLADRTKAVCTDSDEGTGCYFSALLEPS